MERDFRPIYNIKSINKILKSVKNTYNECCCKDLSIALIETLEEKKEVITLKDIQDEVRKHIALPALLNDFSFSSQDYFDCQMVNGIIDNVIVSKMSKYL